MKRYRVELREIWGQDVIVEANSPLEAARKARDGEGIMDDNAFYYVGPKEIDYNYLNVNEEIEEDESQVSDSN